ncbi:MAG: hypothetical protein AAF547_09890, partial [Actinomycetota bacterium]
SERTASLEDRVPSDPTGMRYRPEERVGLLTDPGSLSSSFSLVELVAGVNEGEQSVRLVGLDGASRSLADPVYFQATRWPSWPGAPLRPFITVGTTMVFSSRGEVLGVDLETGATTAFGEGVAVIDGVDGDDFWIISPGERWVTHQRLDPDAEPARYPFGAGRPLVATRDGLLVFPRQELDRGALALWDRRGAFVPIPMPDDAELLGATAEMIVVGDGERLWRIGRDGQWSWETELASPLDMNRAALSPDGSWVALAQSRPLTSLGTVVIVDTASGETVATLEGVVDREFSWTSPTTLVTVDHDGEYQLIEYDVVTGRRTGVARLGYPWVFVVATGR